ncbi:unnamed protein product [Spirodela intermedia]|uniref:non-specific serine/threonine protein kinase n=2 Tax=Spirodela intermedia TaxID=51605 RepID=A0A7I8J510_SPIIN|nr:unnamed protein product [Spirodela intermedia]CAA6664470.1 unnamed protein product [Spirodela intermedia]
MLEPIGPYFQRETSSGRCQEPLPEILGRIRRGSRRSGGGHNNPGLDIHQEDPPEPGSGGDGPQIPTCNWIPAVHLRGTQGDDDELQRGNRQGGFGSVYRGLLEDGKTPVAVKRLEGVTQGEAEFWAEVAVIGRINHINLVRVLGFCAEGKHRLLVYEYLENGSLDRLLFASDATKVLNWEKRYAVAVGTAMGLAYLHEECLEWVLHCDVKPQNILLDEQYRPKLADFGMSKLTERGAAGVAIPVGRYMAPEWMVNQEITAKADVYSFGVVLLELVTGKSATGVSEGQWNHLIRWVEEKMEGRHGMDQMVDEGLNGGYDEVQAELVLRVALFCVRTNKDERPAMSTVVGLLHGDLSPDDESSHGSLALRI